MEYHCPLCKSVLREHVGNAIHPSDPDYGITLDCSNLQCPAQEVMGHGNKAKDAYQVILERFCNERRTK